MLGHTWRKGYSLNGMNSARTSRRVIEVEVNQAVRNHSRLQSVVCGSISLLGQLNFNSLTQKNNYLSLYYSVALGAREV